MPTVHYMKRGFYSHHGLPLPQVYITSMKNAQRKKNTSACTQAAAITTGGTTPPAQETAPQTDKQTISALIVPRSPPATIMRTILENSPSGITISARGATSRAMLSF